MASIGPLQLQQGFQQGPGLSKAALLQEPEHPEALYNLGVLASEEGKPEEAWLLLHLVWVAGLLPFADNSCLWESR